MGIEKLNRSWREDTIRVSKYDTKYRDVNGIYQKDEWTSFSDINKDFAGERLTFEVYLNIEDKYAKAVKWFFLYHNCDLVRIVNLSTFNSEDDTIADIPNSKLLLNTLTEGSIINLSVVETLVKLILRGELWAELLSYDSDDVAVRFGYDFYMYFNSPNRLDDLLEKIKDEGLFID